MDEFKGEMVEIREIRERLDKIEERLEQLEAVQWPKVQYRVVGPSEPVGEFCEIQEGQA